MKNHPLFILMLAMVIISWQFAGFGYAATISNDSILNNNYTATLGITPADHTGAVRVITPEQFNQGYTVTAEELFQGKVAGLRIIKEGGSLGGFRMQLRGRASLLTSNNPLIVVDGLPLSGDNEHYGMTNPLFFLDPSDIASITVLKDAVATSAYGGRGAYGVIIINTKSAEKDSSLSIDYSSHVSLNNAPPLYDVMDAASFRSLINQRYSGQADITSLMGQGNTHWQQELYRNAFSGRHNIALSGNPLAVPVRASFGLTENNGAMHTDRFGRIGGQLRITPSLLDDHLSVDINLMALRANHQMPGSGIIQSAISFDPTQDVMDHGNNFGNYFAWQNSQMPQAVAPANPVAQLYQEKNRVNINRYIAQAGINYSMRFLPALKASVRYSHHRNESRDSQWVSDLAAWQYIAGGYQQNSSLDLTNEMSEFFLSYDSPLLSLNGHVNVVAGYSHQALKTIGSSFASNIPENAAGVDYYVHHDVDYSTELYHGTLFGMMQYSLNDRYLFNVSLNRNSFSGFSEAERVKVLPSVSFAWKIHQEAFMGDASLMESLKWRIGYGKTSQTQFSTEVPSMIYYGLGWPEQSTLNTGMDYVLAGNRLSVSIDYYRSTTSHMYTLLPQYGNNMGLPMLVNLGEMKSNGLELDLNVIALQTSNLRWQAGLNASWSRSVINAFAFGDEQYFTGISFANVFMHSPGQQPFSWYLLQQVYDQGGNPVEGMYVDQNNDGVISEADMIFFPGPDPDLLMGLSSLLQWKQWHMGFSGRLSLGNYVYNHPEGYKGYFSAMYNPAGPHLSNLTSQSFDRGFESQQSFSSHFIENASFFRLDHLTMGYDFRNIFQGRVRLGVTATVHNLFLITQYSGPDPEVPLGIDYGYFPRPQLFVLGVRLNY